MGEFERYSVHWVPPLTNRLARFGLGWTGWCAETASRHHRVPLTVDGVDFRPLTKQTSRQGFHGLIRAPFRLKDPHRIWALERELYDAAESCPEVVLPPLVVGVADGRVALMPSARDEALSLLLTRIGGAVAAFAAAEPPLEVPPCAITDGVPVRSRHRFHMPLTDPLPLPAACSLAKRIAPSLEPLIKGRSVISEIALVHDAGRGRRLRVVQRFPLGEASAPACEPFACRGPRLLSVPG